MFSLSEIISVIVIVVVNESYSLFYRFVIVNDSTLARIIVSLM